MTTGRRTARWVAAGALVAAVVAVGVLISRSASTPAYEVSVTVPAAVNLLPGQPIKVGGNPVGSIVAIVPIRRGRAAKITLGLTDDRAYPLHEGATMDARWGGTASFENRYIRLDPGPASAPSIPNGAAFPARDFITPVEFDQLLATFDRPTRAGVKAMIDATGPALQQARHPLSRALDVAPPALNAADGLLSDLESDHTTLGALLRSTDSMVGAVQQADPNLSTLLAGTARTANAIATRAGDMEQTLQQLPAALGQTDTTLGHASRTLSAAGALAVHLSPGVGQLRAIARPLDSVLAGLTAIGPNAISTLGTVRTGAPQITKLLAALTRRAPELTSIGTQATKQVGCLRPYTPELMGLTETWGDFLSPTDGHDRYLRAQVENYAPAFFNDVPYTPAQAMKIYPGMTYAFPNPPGNLVDQPWFQPQCGVTKDALNPADDQEVKEKGGQL
jgi:ABC-type transporter Mla subunit MlaD